MVDRLYVVYDNHGHHATVRAQCPEQAIRAARGTGRFHKRATLHYGLISLYQKDDNGNNSTYVDLGKFGANGWATEE